MNALLPGGTRFTELNVANDINNSGMFVGAGKMNGVDHGFVGQICDVPEPGTRVMLTAWIVGCLIVALWRLAPILRMAVKDSQFEALTVTRRGQAWGELSNAW